MARIRSIDFLPEIFKTETNRQFLASTLDQLVQEPKFKPTDGYIGRKFGPGDTAMRHRMTDLGAHIRRGTAHKKIIQSAVITTS